MRRTMPYDENNDELGSRRWFIVVAANRIEEPKTKKRVYARLGFFSQRAASALVTYSTLGVLEAI